MPTRGDWERLRRAAYVAVAFAIFLALLTLTVRRISLENADKIASIIGAVVGAVSLAYAARPAPPPSIPTSRRPARGVRGARRWGPGISVPVYVLGGMSSVMLIYLVGQAGHADDRAAPAPSAAPSPSGPEEPTTFVLPSAPPPAEWMTDATTCGPKKEWSVDLPGRYKGHVYAHLTTGRRIPSEVTITLNWATKTWRGQVPIHPGAIDRRVGGTALMFQKLGSTADDPPDHNTFVVLTASTPVCAAFGTALNKPLPAPIHQQRTGGWK
jgi:hypothetical protein